MSYDGSIAGPRIVAYNLASETYEYIVRLVGLGVFEGGLGEMKFTPEVQRVLDALHVVVAGGEAKIDITHRGNPDIVSELAERLRKAQEMSNEINKKAGFYFTAAG